MSICMKVRRAKETGNAMASMVVFSTSRPASQSIFDRSDPTASWPIQPSARPAPVIASCVAERYFSRFSTICLASFAVGCQSFSLMANWDWRTLTRANSVATKKALKPMRSIVINNAELGSGVIFSYCRVFILFRKSRHGYFTAYGCSQFRVSYLSSEISYISKTYNKNKIY